MEISILVNKLKVAANELNQVSDELGKKVAEIDACLKTLGLGIVVWVLCASSHENRRGQLGVMIDGWERNFGYARIKSTWGLACQQVRWVDGKREVEVWLFNEAPRWMRIEMIGALPDLLDEMVVRADDMRVKMQKKRMEAEAMLNGIQVAQKIGKQ